MNFTRYDVTHLLLDSSKVLEVQNKAKDVIANVVLPAFKKMDTYIQVLF